MFQLEVQEAFIFYIFNVFTNIFTIKITGEARIYMLKFNMFGGQERNCPQTLGNFRRGLFWFACWSHTERVCLIKWLDRCYPWHSANVCFHLVFFLLQMINGEPRILSIKWIILRFYKFAPLHSLAGMKSTSLPFALEHGVWGWKLIPELQRQIKKCNRNQIPSSHKYLQQIQSRNNGEGIQYRQKTEVIPRKKKCLVSQY